jgi:hypothetical protein
MDEVKLEMELEVFGLLPARVYTNAVPADLVIGGGFAMASPYES